MMEFTGFDLFALALLFISGVTALMRGFVREALTVAAFVAAALAALWALPVFSGLAAEFTGSGLAANLAAFIVVFLLVYLAVSFITSSLQKNVKSGEDVSVIDRSLGFVFGLVRGLVLLGLLIVVIQNTFPNGNRDWLTQSRLYPLSNAAANLLYALAPEGSYVRDGAPDEAEGDEAVDPPPETDDPIGDLIERTRENDG